MPLKRCPSCRTLCDAARSSVCFACGGDLAATPVAPPPAEPEVLRTARRDHASSSALLRLFAIFGGIGVFKAMTSPGIAPAIKLGLGALLAGALLFGAWSETRGSASGSAGRIILQGFAVVGMIVAIVIFGIVGLVILLFAACSLGALR